MRPQTPVDPELQPVRLSTGPLFASRTGEGAAVVGVHGLPATSRDFRWLDAAFEGRVCFRRIDLPGFGRSPEATAAEPTIGALAASVVEFCEAEGLRDAVLVGHSMGAPVAVEAATRSDRVAGLVLVNPAGPVVHRAMFQRTYRTLVRVAEVHRVVRRVVISVGVPVARAVGFSKRLSPDELLWSARLCGGYEAARVGAQLRSLSIPVLVAWAADDRAVQEAVPLSICEHARHPETLRFDEGGHNLQASRAVELADAIVAFTERLAAGR